jgi:hypothetical protein
MRYQSGKWPYAIEYNAAHARISQPRIPLLSQFYQLWEILNKVVRMVVPIHRIVAIMAGKLFVVMIVSFCQRITGGFAAS